MVKVQRIITGFLGISMFMFGVLKFIDPFKGWYTVQVQASQLPFQELSYWAGQFGEIIVGAILILVLINLKRWSSPTVRWLITASSLGIIIMMFIAIYVHQHPDVPGDVLPLKIKPPFIPGFFLILSAVNIILSNKASGTGKH